MFKLYKKSMNVEYFYFPFFWFLCVYIQGRDKDKDKGDEYIYLGRASKARSM
ncbi:hypothetical protein BDZ91DRAFT_753776, partial [Kalaharituber pfeilii]